MIEAQGGNTLRGERISYGVFPYALFFVAGNILFNFSGPFLITALVVVLFIIFQKRLVRLLLIFLLSGGVSRSIGEMGEDGGQSELVTGNVQSVLPIDELIVIKGIVEEKSQTKAGMQKLTVKLTADENVIFYVREGQADESRHGDEVSVKCKLRQIENFTEEFDYKSLMASRGIWRYAFVEACDIEIFARDRVGMRYFIARLRSDFGVLIDSKITSSRESALLKSVSMGDRSDMDREQYVYFQKSGAMHTLAISGLHIGILYMLIGTVLSLLGGHKSMRILRVFIMLSVMWFYTLFTGMTPSITRAAIMVSIYEMSMLFNRDKSGLNALGLSAIIITLLDPSAPMKIGFQLSFSAMMAIFIIFPFLRDRYKSRNRIVRYFWDSATLSIACQVGTAPLILLYFDNFPMFFILTNFVVIPLINLILIFLSTALLTCNIQVVNDIMWLVLEKALWLMSEVVEKLGAF